MGVENVQIIFDDPTAVFTPGQTITGRVLIVISSSVKIKNIKLKFRGEANVRWTETKSRTRTQTRNNNRGENHSVSYHAREEYFKNKFFLVGAKGESQLEVGEYVYPFNFSLPHELPSTFKGVYGKVFYIAKVKINIPWRTNIEKELMFEVISPTHLNNEPSLAKPKTALKEKYYCCCLCKSGPMTLIVHIPGSGFLPGQSIPVTVELDNNSNVDVDTIKIKLDRTLEYRSQFPSSKINYEHNEIVNVYIDGVEKHDSKTRVEQLQIPNGLTVPNLKHCEIITDKYFLNVEAHVKGAHLNEVASIKIQLGSTPLTIASNDRQFDYSFQPSNPLPSVGVNEPISVPGYAQLVVPSNQLYTVPQNASFHNAENGMIFVQNIQLSEFPNPPPPYQFSEDPEITSAIPMTTIEKF
ncbi:unnamed protein product [Macrosiphum euphorbiae]|uniref:Arrestin C-terminal-like domain-containing protein n=1 Tax=Macrosiphum euphorbiae TaxID=13131 RepID=A0AAV0VV85_9HEMI|nr:unnamed protein product [Macrosiphum euphorbiae]